MIRETLWLLDVSVDVSIYALLALSVNLVNGHARMFHVGHHGIVAAGAFAAALSARALEGAVPGPLGLLLSLGAAAAVAGAAGVAMALPCIRVRGDYLAITTLGLGEILQRGIANLQAQALPVPRLLMTVGPATKLPYRAAFLLLGAVCCVLAAVAVRNAIRSGPGRRLLAVAQDETAARLSGIEPVPPRVAAIAAGAAGAGLAGGLLVSYGGTVAADDFTILLTVKLLLIVVLGGRGSQAGCVLGAAIFVILERLLDRTGGVLYEWWQVEYPLVLALLLLLRPNGILGGRELGELTSRATAGSR